MATAVQAYLELADGSRMPALGMGTWKAAVGEVKEAVKLALRLGYRYVDCSPMYGNQREVGEALREATTKDGRPIPREDVYIVSKLWNTDHHPNDVRNACLETLNQLGVDYLDQFLIHWPICWAKQGSEMAPVDENGHPLIVHVDTVDTWKAMEQLVDEGLVKTIGVSNFSIEQMEALLPHCRIRPVVNQVECHPYFRQEELREWMGQHNIALVAYCPLGIRAGKPTPLDDPVVTEIATRLNKSPGQVVLRWGLQSGHVVIPKATNPAHIQQNAEVLHEHALIELREGETAIELSEEDMHRMNSLPVNIRLVNPAFGPRGAGAFDDWSL